MSLEAGTRLGPYEIVAPIGAGGMGEVYKARDTRLDRTVAVKVLPEHLAENPERKQRFEREAKAISQLNHPHICTLYDIRLRQGYGGQVGEANGIDYMVLEYIEGETLTDRLNKGALPLDEALEYGMQIADGLDKAHRAGIVHRDLKPGNVMLAKSGIKILDFGLARLMANAPLCESSDAPTQQKNLTGERAILGTLQYMAPEQLEGKPADARSDHWALGCLLYEMITAKKAFEGGSQASLISAIMTADAPAASSLKPITPPALDRLVSTCLAKDPDERWQSAGDLRRELAWIASHDDVRAERVATSRNRWLGWVVAGVLGVMLVFASLQSSAPPESPSDQPVRFVLDLPRGQVLPGFNVPGVRSSFARYEGRTAPSPLAISSDGARIVYEAESESTEPSLYLRELSELESERLPETTGANNPFFSPDGEWIGFWAEGRLWKMSLSRRHRTALCQVTPPMLGITWLLDDTIVFGDNTGRLMRLSANGGDPEVLTEPKSSEGERQHFAPHALPDGQTLLFTVETDSGAFISALNTTNGEWKRLREGRWPQYVASGFMAFSSPTDVPTTVDVLAVRFDPRSMETVGAPFPVLQSLYAGAFPTASRARALRQRDYLEVESDSPDQRNTETHEPELSQKPERPSENDGLI